MKKHSKGWWSPEARHKTKFDFESVIERDLQDMREEEHLLGVRSILDEKGGISEEDYI